jgi:hypothetical protein
VLRHILAKLVDDVTHAMHLPLPEDVTGNTAGVLNILLAIEDLPNRRRFLAHRVPKVHCEDQ